MSDNINKKNDDDLSLNLDDLGSDTLSFSEDLENLESINTDEINLDDIDLETPIDVKNEKDTKIEEIDISEDLSRFEIDNTIQDTETVDIDSNPLSEENPKSESDIDNFDLEILEETSPMTDDKIKYQKEDEIIEDIISSDDFDLKTDLGLKDELNLSDSKSDNTNINQYENISDITLDEYGVDLKSGPVTISAFDKPNNIIDYEINTVLKKDISVLNIDLPENNPITIDDDQADFLSKDFEIEETTDIKTFDKEQMTDNEIENLSLDILEDQALKSVSENEFITDEDILKLDNSSLGNFDISEDILTEDIPDELSLTEEDTIIENIKDDMLIEEIPEINLIDEDGLIKDLDIDTLDKTNSVITGDNMMKKEDDDSIKLDIEEISDIEEDIFPLDNDMPELDEEIKNTSISGSSDDLSNSISPLSDSSSVLTGTNNSNENIEEFQLDDLDNITNDSSINDIKELDLDNISRHEISTLQVEEDTIGLSGDELDNILNTTEIIETPSNEITESDYLEESETIDLSNFEADLKVIATEEINLEDELIKEESSVEKINISPEEEEEIYNSLKAEMQKKTQKETKDNLSDDLKDEVKSVLSYLDQLLDALPDEKIKEFAESKAFDTYKKLFEELNIKN